MAQPPSAVAPCPFELSIERIPSTNSAILNPRHEMCFERRSCLRAGEGSAPPLLRGSDDTFLIRHRIAAENKSFLLSSTAALGLWLEKCQLCARSKASNMSAHRSCIGPLTSLLMLSPVCLNSARSLWATAGQGRSRSFAFAKKSLLQRDKEARARLRMGCANGKSSRDSSRFALCIRIALRL